MEQHKNPHFYMSYLGDVRLPTNTGREGKDATNNSRCYIDASFILYYYNMQVYTRADVYVFVHWQYCLEFPIFFKHKCTYIVHNEHCSVTYIECVGRLISLSDDIFNLIGEFREIRIRDMGGSQEGICQSKWRVLVLQSTQ